MLYQPLGGWCIACCRWVGYRDSLIACAVSVTSSIPDTGVYGICCRAVSSVCR